MQSAKFDDRRSPTAPPPPYQGGFNPSDPRFEDKPPPYTPSQNYQGGFDPNNPSYAALPSPPPGFQPYPVQTAAPPLTSYGTASIVISPPADIVIVGGCPACRVGVLEDDFTCFGIFCAIFCFPVGILCCLACRDRRCSNCGAYFG